MSITRPRRGEIPSVTIEDFKYGVKNYLVPQKIERGAASDSLNWLTLGSKIEVRHGYSLLGATRNTGTGLINGLFTAHKWDGTEVIFRARGTKLEFLDETIVTPDWVEVGSNILVNEDVSFAEYFSPAGSQLWVSSPTSGLFKIMTANPGSSKNVYTSAKNFRGRIQIKQNRMLLWNYVNGAVPNVKGATSNNVLQMSYIDSQTYTTVTAEIIGSGNGVNKTFTGTLASLTGTRTGFAVTVTDGTETFTDNYLGVLTGNLGGTGTINYTTGAISVTFNTAPANTPNNVTSTYSYEDSNAGGISDFTRSATRTAGQGVSFVQNEGGDLLNVFSYNNVEYCVHQRKAYALTISIDDTTATNLIYRDKLGMPNWRAGVASADGIFYLDNTDKSRQYFAVIKYNSTGLQVLPEDLSSEVLDLTNFSFDQSSCREWNQYIVYSARTLDSTKNNRLFLYSKIFGSWDIVDLFASDFSLKSGSLLGGDSVSNNVYTFFANFDDDGNLPNTFWQGNIDEYGIENLKKTKQLWLEGEIQPDQAYDVLASLDRGSFTKVGTISGQGSYVDQGTSVTVGSNVVGLQVVGGGSIGQVTANHYLHGISLNQGKFKTIQLKFVTTGIGYVSITQIKHFDIRTHEDKLPRQYR